MVTCSPQYREQPIGSSVLAGLRRIVFEKCIQLILVLPWSSAFKGFKVFHCGHLRLKASRFFITAGDLALRRQY